MTERYSVRRILGSSELIDRLASAEHDRWARWQRYVHANCRRLEDGSLVIPANLVARWERQIETSFVNLSEGERESDREQVRQYLPLVIEALEDR